MSAGAAVRIWGFEGWRGFQEISGLEGMMRAGTKIEKNELEKNPPHKL